MGQHQREEVLGPLGRPLNTWARFDGAAPLDSPEVDSREVQIEEGGGGRGETPHGPFLLASAQTRLGPQSAVRVCAAHGSSSGFIYSPLGDTLRLHPHLHAISSPTSFTTAYNRSSKDTNANWTVNQRWLSGPTLICAHSSRLYTLMVYFGSSF